VNIRISERAASQIERSEDWWREQRPDARELFREELQAVLGQLEQMPHLGQIYQGGRRVVRRILMPRTRNHVYYQVIGDDEVQVVTVASAVGKRAPRL
jgi:plasmid stabilization system protein ParE